MSTYFKLAEWTCRDAEKTPYPTEWVSSRWEELAALSGTIRERWSEALVVSSGYRTKKYNNQIGGARRSQHPEGRAAICGPKGFRSGARAARLDPTDVQQRGASEAASGLGYYPTFVHVDTRKSPKLVRWTGSRTEN